jgi:protein gp37
MVHLGRGAALRRRRPLQQGRGEPSGDPPRPRGAAHRDAARRAAHRPPDLQGLHRAASDGTKIEWTDATWNVVNGCSVVSPGCKHCYAMKQAHRFPVRQGLTQQPLAAWSGPARSGSTRVLLDPLRWRGRARSSSAPTATCSTRRCRTVDRPGLRRHGARAAARFQVLTKRPERLREYADEAMGCGEHWLAHSSGRMRRCGRSPTSGSARASRTSSAPTSESPSCSTRPRRCAGYRASRCSGRSRPMHPKWARSLRDQCEWACVPFLFKQWGEWTPMPAVADHPIWGQPLPADRITLEAGAPLYRVGKKVAGRLLDGVQHDGYPA